MKQPQDETTVNMTAMLDAVKASDETATTKTGSTPPTSDTASQSSTLNDEPETPHQYGEQVLAQLARQLEYYFSQANLEKDTYVETLRQLNDGFVPVSILQRFSKVQTLVPFETVEAILKATVEHTSLLEVASIDSKTGKRVEEENSNTILAIGSCSGEPLENNSLQSVVASSPNTPGTPIQNTIIIREVDSRIGEAEVRALFDDEHCPPIVNLYLDVFNCWFVTLDTTSRDDMLYVMMSLRSQYLGDEPVKARLKSLVRSVDPAAAPHLPVLTPVTSYAYIDGLSPPQEGPGTNKSKGKKKKNRSKNNANSNKGNNGNQGNSGKKSGNAHNGNQNSANASNTKAGNSNKKAAPRQPKPDLSVASFPALSPDSSPKIEVVVDGGMETGPKPSSTSDSASTTTTLSSSSSSMAKGSQVVSGGYAAALRKSKSASALVAASTTPKAKSVAKGSDSGKDKKPEAADEEKAFVAAPPKPSPLVVKPPTWGGGRSFADVLAR